MKNFYIPNAYAIDDFYIELINAITDEKENVYIQKDEPLYIYKVKDTFFFIQTQGIQKKYKKEESFYFVDTHFYTPVRQVTAVELFDNPGDCNYFLRKFPEERIKSINYTDGKFWITYLADYRPTFKELFE